jgi:NAD+ diphosphatase
MKTFNEKYCRFCGEQLGLKNLSDGSTEKYCSNCDYVFFPALTPAVIVLITFDKQILLSRSVGWEHPYWGFIAGHINPGETANEAVLREVKEEVSLEISVPQFITSYTHKTDRDILMLAFGAEAKNQNIILSQELTAAQWFDKDGQLPIRPGSMLEKIINKSRSGHLF